MADVQYDPSKVLITIGGFVMKSFGADTKVTVEFAEDANSMHIGCDGDGRFVKNKNRSGSVTLTLSGKSSSNQVLTLLEKTDQPFPIAIIDKNSAGDAFFSDACKVQTMASYEAGKDQAEKVWVFGFIKGEMNPAGAKQA